MDPLVEQPKTLYAYPDECGPTYNNSTALTDVMKIHFQDIVDRAVIQLASLGVTDIYELLSIDDTNIDGFIVMCTILKDTIDSFEIKEPFGIKIAPYYTAGQVYKFQNNFWDFLYGNISRTNLEFIPRHIVSIVGTYLGTLRGVDYKAPYLSNITYTGRYRTKILANRPYKMARDGEKFTKDSYYYFLGEEEKPRLKRFRDLFLVNLGAYIIKLNKNLDHPNMPLSTFEGLQEFISELKQTNDRDFETSFGYYDAYDDR